VTDYRVAMGQGLPSRAAEAKPPSPYHTAPPDFDGVGMDTPANDVAWLCEQIEAMRSRGNLFPTVVEVGSWTGRTAIAMADAGARVFCIDHWQGSPGDPNDVTEELVRRAGGPSRVFATFLKNVGARLYRTVFPCIGPSDLWAHWWQVPADMVFLDGDHRYEAVRDDIAGWARHVKPGGLLVGHDFKLFDGVRRAVTESVPGFSQAGACLWWQRR